MFQSAESTYSRVCLTRFVPLPGFFNLLAAYSSADREALFHASYTHGVLLERVPLTSIHPPFGVPPLLPLDEYHTNHYHGVVAGLPYTQKVPFTPHPDFRGLP